MRVIIAGGRDFNNYELLKSKCLKIFKELKLKGLDTSRENLEIISGTANGADKLGERFAKEYNLKIKRFPANWDLYGKSAGYKRNEQMALYAKEDNGVLVAFWDGKSKGTAHMIKLVKKCDLITIIVDY